MSMVQNLAVFGFSVPTYSFQQSHRGVFCNFPFRIANGLYFSLLYDRSCRDTQECVSFLSISSCKVGDLNHVGWTDLLADNTTLIF